MSIYITPSPPHSGLTALLGGEGQMYYHIGPLQYDFLRSLYSGGSSVSATTFYSGSTDMNTILQGAMVRVQPGTNTITGGTSLVPTINVVPSPSFISVSALTLFSGSTDLSSLIPAPTYVQGGINTSTGGTPSRPAVNVSLTPSFTSVFATSVSATTLFSGAVDLSRYLTGDTPTYVQSGVNTTTGGTASRPTVDVVASPSFTSVSAATFFSGASELGSLFPLPTYVQSGVNTTTGGTASRPTVDVVASPSFSSVFATSISATTLFSGAVDLSRYLTGSTPTYVQPGTNTTTGGTPFRPTVDVVASPSFTSVSAGTYIIGSTNIQDMFAPIGSVVNPQNRTFFVSQSGSDADGLTPSTAFNRLENAISKYLVDYNDATIDNPFSIVVLDTGIYSSTATLIIPDHVAVNCSQANIFGDVVLCDGSKLWVKNHYPINGSSPLVSNSPTATTSYYKADVMDTRGLGGEATSMGVSSSGAIGQLHVDIKKLYVTTIGVGVKSGVSNGYIHINIEGLYLENKDAIGLRSESGSITISTIIGYVHHILKGGSSVNTTAFELVGGRMSLMSNEILCDTLVSIGLGAGPNSQLDLVCPYIAVDTQFDTDFGDSAQIALLTKNIISSTSPSWFMSGLTAASMSGVSVSATTFFSGSVDISQYLTGSTPTYVQNGVNTTTGGTASRPTVNVSSTPTFTNVFATSISATTLFSGAVDLSRYLTGSTPTYVQPGINTTTGGTASRPTVNVSSTPTFTSVFATSVSASTLYSGASELSSLFLLSPTTGTTTVDFGFSSGGEGDFTSTTVSNSNVRVSSIILMNTIASDDHPEIGEALLDEVSFMSGDIVDGTSFIINGYAERGTWGQYNVMYRIIN